MDRRRFFSAAAGIAALRPGAAALAQSAGEGSYGRPADLVARDEDYWMNIRHAFTVDRNLINLNNGGVSPSPKMVSDTETRYLEIENMAPSYYMWRDPRPGMETVAGGWPACSAATRRRSRSRATPARRSRSCSWAWT